MNILTTSTALQNLTVIPRYEPTSVSAYVTDETTRTTTTFDSTPVYTDGWLIISHSFELIEARMYTLEIKDSNTLVYRGRIYCTDQEELDKYQPTSGSYVTSNDVSDENIILI